MERKLISIVVPCYNEELTVEKFYTDYFIFELPDAYTLAEEVYSLYREFFAERTDIDMRAPHVLREAALKDYAPMTDDVLILVSTHTLFGTRY